MLKIFALFLAKCKSTVRLAGPAIDHDQCDQYRESHPKIQGKR